MTLMRETDSYLSVCYAQENMQYCF